MPASYSMLAHDSISNVVHHVPHLGLLVHDGIDDVHVHVLVLALGSDLEYLHLMLLTHIDLPVLVILDVSLVLLVLLV